jgi:hypothetical protein
MARKFLQMGYTRSRRYANHKSGKKYRANPQLAETLVEQKEARKDILPLDLDPVKAKSAAIFKQKWHEAKNNSKYQRLLQLHQQQHQDNNGTQAN